MINLINICKNDLDDAFFNQNWAGACWDRWAGIGVAAGPVRWLWTPLQK